MGGQPGSDDASGEAQKRMTISEPVTLVTDYLLALLTGLLAYWMWSRSYEAAGAGRIETSSWLRWWSAAYAASAVSGVFGGTVHGFSHALRPPLLAGLWMVTLQSLVVAGFAVVCAVIAVSRAHRARARWMAGLAFGACGLWVAAHPVFLSALVPYSAALLVVTVFALRHPLSASSRLLLSGIAVSVVAAAIQRSRLSLHPHFNHNDLFHVVQGLAVWLLYRGVMRHDALPARR